MHNNGISHFLEHMFFKGTEKRNAQEIAESFDAIGAQINAFTSKEYTCYFVRVLDTHKEYALEMLADMFFDSIFAEEEIKREDRKSTRLNSSHVAISYAVFCLKKKKK